MNNNALFVYELTDKEMEYVIEKISNFTSSNFIKFKVIKDNIVINFSTTLEFSKLEQVVELIFKTLDKMYFLVEYGENMSVCLPDDQSEQFLNTEEVNETLLEETILDEMNIEGNELLRDYILSLEDINLDDEEEDLLIKKSNKVTYSLDDILDKINEKGMDSLTKQERNYLNNLHK
jgi:hypothetical protein